MDNITKLNAKKEELKLEVIRLQKEIEDLNDTIQVAYEYETCMAD